jgi:hypothetical protein
MRKALIACLAAPTVLYAQNVGPGLKPGLWEVQVVKQVVDGRDVSAQASAATSQMQQAMEHMPPEQRARMEAMLKQHGVAMGAHGYRICITPEMAKRASPIIDKEGRCRTSNVTHAANRTSFAFTCRSGDTTTTGTGVSTITSDLVTTGTDATTENAAGEKHTMQVESRMRYVRADCGEVKPPAAGK